MSPKAKRSYANSGRRATPRSSKVYAHGLPTRGEAGATPVRLPYASACTGGRQVVVLANVSSWRILLKNSDVQRRQNSLEIFSKVDSQLEATSTPLRAV